MSTFKCEICGGTVQINADHISYTCEYCGVCNSLTEEMRVYIEKMEAEEARIRAEAEEEKQLKKEKREKCLKSLRKIGKFLWMHKLVTAVLVIVLLIIGNKISQSIFYGVIAIENQIDEISSSNQKYEWPNSGLAQKIPQPTAEYGEIITNTDERFYISCYKTSKDEFEEYVEECKKGKFTLYIT